MFARFHWALTVVFAVIASSASAQSATSVAQGSTTIVDPVSLTVNQVLTIVAVTRPGAGTPNAGRGSGGGVGGLPNGAPIIASTPTSYAVRDGGGQTLSVAVPQTLELVQVGGDETVTLTTNTGIITGSGMDLLGGPLGAEGALSFAVADRAEAFGTEDEFRALLVLTAQYN